MAAKTRLADLEQRITELHERRHEPPLVRWIRRQDTDTLRILADRLERGLPLDRATKGLVTHDPD
jgi:hypothetical protein